MSLFNCLDILEKRKKSIAWLNSLGIEKYRRETACINELSDEINNYIELLKSSSSPNTVITVLSRLHYLLTRRFLSHYPNAEYYPDYLAKVIKIIDVFKKSAFNVPNQNENLIFANSSLNLFNRFLKAHTSQSVHDQMLGTSGGECYGFVSAMADSRYSPYITDNKYVTLDHTIHAYQINQTIRQLDQGDIKRSRLTIERFCPDIKTQALEIAAIAKKYKEEHLTIRRIDINNGGGHACYLRVKKTNIGEIYQYMDPNYGAYEFPNQDLFKAFFEYTSAQYEKEQICFRYYAMGVIREDLAHHLQEKTTFAGKVRSFLSGRKYDSPAFSLLEIIKDISIGGGIGLIIGAMIGSTIPIIGTILGGIIGSVVGMFVYEPFQIYLHGHGHTGFLGVINYFRNVWHNWTSKPQPCPSFLELSALIKNIQTPDKSDALLDAAPSANISASSSEPIRADDMLPFKDDEPQDDDSLTTYRRMHK